MGVIAEKTWRKQAGLAISLKGLVTFKMEFHSLKSMSIFMLTILHFRENIAKVSMTHPALRRRGPITSSMQLFDTSHPPKQTPNLSKQERKTKLTEQFHGVFKKAYPSKQYNLPAVHVRGRKMTILFSINRAGLRASAVRWSFHTGMSDGLTPHQSI